MDISNQHLKQFSLQRELLNVRREDLESHNIQGFLLEYSESFLLFRYVHDFYFDGLLLLRRSDVTDLFCRETDRFQRGLLQVENQLKERHFKANYPVHDLEVFLGALDKKKIVILENEDPDVQDFYIGRIASVSQDTVQLHEFSGTGKWARQPTEINLSQITCCQLETNYIQFYQRYFDRS